MNALERLSANLERKELRDEAKEERRSRARGRESRAESSPRRREGRPRGSPKQLNHILGKTLLLHALRSVLDADGPAR